MRSAKSIAVILIVTTASFCFAQRRRGGGPPPGAPARLQSPPPSRPNQSVPGQNAPAPNAQQQNRIEHFTPEQRQRAEAFMSQFRGLPEDRRQLVGQAARRLADMDPEQQQKLLDSPAGRQKFSDQERDILRGVLELRIGPATPRNEEPPPGFD